MESPRYPAVLHQGGSTQQIEVTAGAQSLTLIEGGIRREWKFAQTVYRSGGVPRFEHGESVLIIADFSITKAIEKLNPTALDEMGQRASGVFSAGDFLTGLKAVAIVMAGAAVLAAIVWYLSK